jgi:GNAT superfamily N-acetyltransferase
VTGGYVIEPLSTDHDRLGFSSGVEPLDRYFREQVGQDMRRRIARCLVVRSGEVVCGYYTFSAASLPMLDLPEDMARKLPRYPVLPAALIGRLAVDHRYRGRGLGAAMVVDAVDRAIRADLAIHALLVDAKDDPADAFYRHLGLLPLRSRPRSLFLPLGRIADRVRGLTP